MATADESRAGKARENQAPAAGIRFTWLVNLDGTIPAANLATAVEASITEEAVAAFLQETFPNLREYLRLQMPSDGGLDEALPLIRKEIIFRVIEALGEGPATTEPIPVVVEVYFEEGTPPGARPDQVVTIKERPFCPQPQTPKVFSSGTMRAFFELCSIESKPRDLFDISRSEGRLGLVYWQGTPEQRRKRREKEIRRKAQAKSQPETLLDMDGLQRRGDDSGEKGHQWGVLLTAARQPDARLLRQPDEVLFDWLWSEIQPDLELIDPITWDVVVYALVEYFRTHKGDALNPHTPFDLWWDEYQEWKGVDDRNWVQDARHAVYSRAEIVTGRRVLLIADEWLHSPHPDPDKKGRPKQYHARHGSILSYREDLIDKNSRRDRERMAFPDGLGVRIGPWAEQLISQQAYIGHYARELARIDYKRWLPRQLGGACFFLTHIFAANGDRTVSFEELMGAACIPDDKKDPGRLFRRFESGRALLREKNLYGIDWADKPPTEADLKRRGFWDNLKPRPMTIRALESAETLKKREAYIAAQKEKAMKRAADREKRKRDEGDTGPRQI